MSIQSIISIALSYILALMAMAFYTLMERKFLGYFQTRKGPNKPILMGLPVPFADAIKLFTKEQAKPTLANQLPFMGAPVLSLSLALLLWALYPHQYQAFYIMFGILYFLCVSSTSVYSTFLAGWCSNSKYALLGALRGVAQTISYEVSMTLILISALVLLNTMDLTMMSMSQSTPTALLVPIMAILWFITNLAETNRTPFDFAEGESELVSGFNVEYSSGLFALIFMAEYTSIIAMSLITSTVFLSDAFSPTLSSLTLTMKTLLLATLFIWVRATMPRMRYDHLMYLTWKSFLPVAIGGLMIILAMRMSVP
nr:NADH dehydrogenase subunit 1 [Tubifex tubifex]